MTTPILIQKKTEYTLDEMETFRDMLKFTNIAAMRAWVTEEGVWSWKEFKAAIDYLLSLPVAPTEKLLVLTEHAGTYGGVLVDAHIVDPEDLARVEKWQSTYGVTPGVWLDAKVLSLREITLREHVILIKLLYTHMVAITALIPPTPLSE